MRYVVTGSAGFIGRHVCSALLAERARSRRRRRLHRLLRPGAQARQHGVAVEPRPVHALSSATSSPSRSTISSRAVPTRRSTWPGSRASGCRGPRASTRTSTATSTPPSDSCEAARRTRVPRLVLASSSSVYGNAASYPVSEDVADPSVQPLRGDQAGDGAPGRRLRRELASPGRDAAVLHGLRAGAASRHGDAPVHRSGGGRRAGAGLRRRPARSATSPTWGTSPPPPPPRRRADLAPGTVMNIAGGSSATVNDVLALVGDSVGRRGRRRPAAHRSRATSAPRAPPSSAPAGCSAGPPRCTLEAGVAQQVAHQLAYSVVGTMTA